MKSKFNCLVIGYGSIGKRHVKILNELGQKVTVVSNQDLDYPIVYQDLEHTILKVQPNYIVVANETNRHESTLNKIKEIGYNQKILVEKPLFSNYSSNSYEFEEIYTGYNLRFHPLIQALYKELRDISIVSVQAYVGQYLPSWRPDTDYTKSYSANATKGGGVIRDLSHELDYLQFLFGDWTEMVTTGGKYSDLNIETDDHYAFTYKTKKVPLITLQMNYLDFITQRFIIVNTNEKTYKVDFVQNTLQINDQIIEFKVNRDDTYRLQHLAILKGETEFLSSFENGLNIVKMIEKAEQSSKEKVWVSNEEIM